ncbi:MAG: hypothetical protein J5497_05595 [Selenomonadaceae bacterium]|nr:hypothetical protein [Selenomonadaceae bacterium]
MRRKKILVYGTAESLQKFFADAISRDFEVVAILSDEPEKIPAVRFDVLAPKNLPVFVYNLIDGIIFTAAEKSPVEFFLKRGLAPNKIILWDTAQGWQSFSLPAKNGMQRIYFCGLEFLIRENVKNSFYNITVRRLQRKRRLRNTPPEKYAELLAQEFKRRTGRTLDYDNVQTFTEKIQWMKIFDATPLKSRLADKYLVRNWVADKIGAEYLIPLLGVWDNFDDINFDDLPEKFVLKCNHGSAMNIVVRDRKKFNVDIARRRINAWLAMDYAVVCIELHYTRIDRKIIAEKFMTNGDLTDIDNYKFWCFGGKPLHCAKESGRSADGSLANLRMDFFDMNWLPTTVERSDHPRSEHPENIPPPKNFELMKKLAATLAEDFAFVRVDFYEIDGKVYFGEMTFTPGAGNFSYKSAGTDEYLGNLLTLPPATPPPQI